MAKRFTDSEKWNDPWFRKLKGEYKLFWIYVLDTCDHAGIWKDRTDQFISDTGFDLDPNDLHIYFQDRIMRLDEETFFIPKFNLFQYPNFNPEKNNAHKGVMRSLDYYGIDYRKIIEVVETQRKNRIKLAPTQPLPRGTGIEQNRTEQNRTEQNSILMDKEQNRTEHESLNINTFMQGLGDLV